MVHDPRAPRLAAACTLGAAILVLLAAVNLVLNSVGKAGFSLEEGVALGVMVVLLIVAQLANKQVEIPSLNASGTRSDVETFDSTLAPTRSNPQNDVNPTTASILTSILGQQQTTTEAQVNSAIDTLSTGLFAANVQRTMDAIETANQQNNIQIRAVISDEETVRKFERVHVQPVPLPGQEGKPLVDPATLPGLEPNRVFVTQGEASVPLPAPLPNQTSPPPSEEHPAVKTDPKPPEMPDLDDLFSGGTSSSDPLTQPPAAPELPDLVGLFAETEREPLTEESALPEVPDLPDLDDLF